MTDERRMAVMSVEFLAAIIDHVAHPIFVKDRQFRFVLVNRALGELLGHAQNELLGKTDYDFFPAAEADFFRQKDVEVFDTGLPAFIAAEPITDAAGAVHILETVKVPRRDASGQVTHLVGIIHDITKVKLAEDALRLANEELEQRVEERTRELEKAQEALVRKERLAVLGQLAGGLAHQLRNPLGAMENAVALLRHQPLSPSQGDLVAIIHEEVRRADRTITDLLDYARIRSPQRRRVDMRVLVEDVLAAEHPSERVEVAVSGTASVNVDPLQIQTALQNVVRNALEAMPHGGRLAIGIARRQQNAEIEIRDNGEGVPESARAILFDPLVTMKAHGIGLGLSTARNLIENNGGSIHYAPAHQGGSVFTVALPLA